MNAQVYQVMPQYGYGPIKRMDIDSALTIPTTCGTPTYRSNLLHKSAIAFDTCNNRFYFYNSKTLVWDTIKGGGGGTAIAYVDSLKRSSDSVYALKGGAWRFQYRDSIGGGTGSDTAKVVVAVVSNAEATTLQRGEVVYLYQATGNRASVKRANNKFDSTSSKTLGIVRDPITAGAVGTITTQGQCDKLNLGSYADGTTLWLDSLSGQFTSTKPQAPYHSVFVGIVERGNNGNGILYVKPQNGYELDEIHDVQITSVANNNMILWNDTTKVWRNRPYSLQTLLNAGNIAQNSGMALNDGSYFSAWANNGQAGPRFSMQIPTGYNHISYADYHTLYNNSFGTTKASSLTIGYDYAIAQYVIGWGKLNTSQLGFQKRLLPRYSINQTANHNYYLPDISGGTDRNLAVSVNGNFADNFGNISVSTGGSTGVNGLNGTTNIGLGGTLTQTTTINGAGFGLQLGSSGSPINALRLNGNQVSFELLNPRHTDNPERCVIAVLDTVSNNVLRTIPLTSLTAEGKVLRGKFSNVYDANLQTYNLVWYPLVNTTGITWSMYASGSGTYRICANCVSSNVPEVFNDCTWFGGVMFEPYYYGAEYTGQIYNINKYEAVVRIMDTGGGTRPEVNNACFEIRFYDNCNTGAQDQP